MAGMTESLIHSYVPSLCLGITAQVISLTDGLRCGRRRPRGLPAPSSHQYGTVPRTIRRVAAVQGDIGHVSVHVVAVHCLGKNQSPLRPLCRCRPVATTRAMTNRALAWECGRGGGHWSAARRVLGSSQASARLSRHSGDDDHGRWRRHSAVHLVVRASDPKSHTHTFFSVDSNQRALRITRVLRHIILLSRPRLTMAMVCDVAGCLFQYTSVYGCCRPRYPGCVV